MSEWETEGQGGATEGLDDDELGGGAEGDDGATDDELGGGGEMGDDDLGTAV